MSIRTKYSSSAWIGRLEVSTPQRVVWLINYWLWQLDGETDGYSSRPTDADVKVWISTLCDRSDSANELIQLMINQLQTAYP